MHIFLLSLVLFYQDLMATGYRAETCSCLIIQCTYNKICVQMDCAFYRMIVKAQQDGNHQSITQYNIKMDVLTSNPNRKQAVLLHNLLGFSQTLPPIAARMGTCRFCFTTTSYIMAPARQFCFSFIYVAVNPFTVIRHMTF